MRLAQWMMGSVMEGDDGAMVCIGATCTDAQARLDWNRARPKLNEVPEGTKFTRHVLYRYSARQLREEMPEHDDYWGEDGELKTFVVAAYPSGGPTDG